MLLRLFYHMYISSHILRVTGQWVKVICVFKVMVYIKMCGHGKLQNLLVPKWINNFNR